MKQYVSISAVIGLMVVGFPGCMHQKRSVGRQRETQTSPYPVVYATVRPTIDGKLDDAIWQQAVPLTTFYEYNKVGQRVDIATAYMAWDKGNLYLGMEIEDKDLYVAEKQNDAVLCRADVAELFLKPRDDRFDLYEFEFNIWNAIWDIHYISRGGGGPRRFAGFFTTGAAVKATHKGTINNWDDEDISWTLEVALPLNAFSRAVPRGPKPGDRWKFNVSGYDFSRYRENTLLFTSCDGNTKGFAEYELYPSMQFMPPR